MAFILKRSVFAHLIIGLIFSFGCTIQAQEVNEGKSQTEKVYNIQNCVNQFSMENVETTKVGYQYWFADKDFIDGRTLKMSVVAPHRATLV